MHKDAITLRMPGMSTSLQLLLHGDNDRIVSAALRRDGIWEPFETALVRDCLQPGQVFVDVGANLGYFSLLAAARVGTEGRVFAFEPDPGNYERMRGSVELNGFATCISVEQAALADKDGPGRLFLSEDNLGDHQVYAGDAQRRSLPIRLLRGADYLASRTTRIDLVKIDTQGSEFHVVQGLLPLLARQMPAASMLVELTPFSLRQAGASGRVLIESLAGLGSPFWIVDHIEHRLVPSSAAELANWCDQVDACDGDRGFMNIFLGASPAGWIDDGAGCRPPNG
jgi:FkbM family methyltransferase